MTLKLFACGDVVNLISNNNFIDDKLVNIIHDCDISICNFEAPIETHGMEEINKVIDTISSLDYSDKKELIAHCNSQSNLTDWINYE